MYIDMRSRLPWRPLPPTTPFPSRRTLIFTLFESDFESIIRSSIMINAYALVTQNVHALKILQRSCLEWVNVGLAPRPRHGLLLDPTLDFVNLAYTLTQLL